MQVIMSMGKEGLMNSCYLNCWGPRHGFQYLVEMAMYAGIVTVCWAVLETEQQCRPWNNNRV
jgi:hypothetical protein